MSANILEFLLAASITVFIGAIAWWARTHPNRSREYPERVRMPKVVPIFGWVGAGVGVLMGSWAWFSSDGPLGARIASLAMLLGGLAFVAMYRNFYVAPRQYEVAFRSSLGKEHVLPYSDIADYHMTVMRGQRFLTAKWTNGTKLSLNITAFDVTPLLRAIDYHRATGRWPVPASAPLEMQPDGNPGYK
ncbi:MULTISPECIES: DUF4282 domain-containing protein [unclassified Arthrobacter]|uniref:DUF4282 domain-containing protein n=1 Tax=unclassified Arthrobacter TaxID=235627 RepID=UPI001E4980C2|nr:MULTISPECIES: DUF4282 domain-containing protein [unclassified Arthrobacter]MCC9144487.1 DUF4282 domain-containing protein [Arthrobacter sp. zg-Y919]MDK1275713.1 DUF4282 domain-containing protein [Arthrobacter sp. zg.Y919]WIB02920.1 DUF4282 domain-containing protein [Arthrobacter sp. zg-Y919]